MTWDALLIGANVDTLVAAHYLARSGRRVLVLDERKIIPAAPLDSGWIPPRIVRDLDLARHGLQVHHADPWVATPLAAGGRLELWQDLARSVEAIKRVSPRDAAKWPEFCERMAHSARALQSLYSAPPPSPMSRDRRDVVQLGGIALRTRLLGRQAIEDLLRLLPMPVADWLDDWFESDALKALLGTAAVTHLCQGPRSGGTAFALLHHHVGSSTGVFRPAVSNATGVLSTLPGVEIRRGQGIARIKVHAGRVAGVVLVDGEEIAAPLVVSGVDPRRTLLHLVDPAWLDPAFARAVRNIRSRGVAARVTLTLEHAPDFATLVVAPSLDYLERAYDDAKYGRMSREPYVEARHDSGPRLNVHVQYAPYTLAEGEWDTVRRAALGETVTQLLAQHVPALRGAIRDREACSPRDLAELEGFPAGQAHHAELALDQALWMRPLPGWARYRMPVAGLYLCGPATHPGAGIVGAAGANAARVILRETRPGRAARAGGEA